MYILQQKVDTLIKYWSEFRTSDPEFKTSWADVTSTDLDISMEDAFAFATGMFYNVEYYPESNELTFHFDNHIFRYDGIELEISQFTKC